MEIVSLFSLFFMIFSRFWDALGSRRGGISRDLPGHPVPFFIPECPKGPQRCPEGIFSLICRRFFANFESIVNDDLAGKGGVPPDAQDAQDGQNGQDAQDAQDEQDVQGADDARDAQDGQDAKDAQEAQDPPLLVPGWPRGEAQRGLGNARWPISASSFSIVLVGRLLEALARFLCSSGPPKSNRFCENW